MQTEVTDALQHHTNSTIDGCKACILLQKSTPNLEGAFKYLKQHVGNKPLTSDLVHGLEEAAGVGVVITPQQIDATVGHHISKVKTQLIEQRYEACLLASLGTQLTFLSLSAVSFLLARSSTAMPTAAVAVKTTAA